LERHLVKLLCMLNSWHIKNKVSHHRHICNTICWYVMMLTSFAKFHVNISYGSPATIIKQRVKGTIQRPQCCWFTFYKNIDESCIFFPALLSHIISRPTIKCRQCHWRLRNSRVLYLVINDSKKLKIMTLGVL